MREFARTETMLEKCHYCGCKNKLYTDIIDCHKEVVGHTLRCCNCGRTVLFIHPEYTGKTGHSNVPMMQFLNGCFQAGPQKCIKESYCPHKNCELYHIGPPPKPGKPDTDSCGCGCKCGEDCDFSNLVEPDVKCKNEPRFL